MWLKVLWFAKKEKARIFGLNKSPPFNLIFAVPFVLLSTNEKRIKKVTNSTLFLAIHKILYSPSIYRSSSSLLESFELTRSARLSDNEGNILCCHRTRTLKKITHKNQKSESVNCLGRVNWQYELRLSGDGRFLAVLKSAVGKLKANRTKSSNQSPVDQWR